MKVSHKHRRFTPLVLLFFSAAVASPLVLQQYVFRSKAQSPLSQHVIHELEPLCRILMPDEPSFSMIAAPPDPHACEIADRKLWTVDCFSTGGEMKLRLLWWESHKEVMWVNHFGNLTQTKTATAINQKQAVEVARIWANRLASSRQKEISRCIYTTQDRLDFWRVHLYLPAGTMSLRIDSYSGLLQMACMQETASPTFRSEQA